MNIYTFRWSNRSGAGTIVIIESTADKALEVARSYFGDDVWFDDEQPCVVGAHVIVTTEQNPI